MRAGALLIALLVAGASAYPTNDEELLKNGIEKLIKEVIEYFRWLLKRHDPYTPPDIPRFSLADDDVNVQISLSDVNVSDETSFSTDQIHFNLPTLKSTFQVTEPSAVVEGTYKVSGVVLKKQISGSGHFSVDISGFVQKGNIQYDIVDHNLQIKDISLDYDVSSVKMNAEGLKIEGMSDEEVKKFINDDLLKLAETHKAALCKLTANKMNAEGLKIEGMSDEEVKKFINDDLLKLAETHKAALCKLTANKVKELVNKFLIGKTLKFVWQLIYSTPDPPPFPFIKH